VALYDTFNELGHAKYTPPLSKGQSGSFTITEKGKKYLQSMQ
jgi:predicted transcriptional regulator